jgi:hypothetical protein
MIMPRPYPTAMLAAAALSACATVQPARMALPAGLVEPATLAVTGIGGRRSGALRAGPYTGCFERSDTRLALFDPLFERRGGRTAFALDGEAGEPALGADCRASERTVTLGIVSFKPGPMAFGCTLSIGTAAAGRLELQEAAEGLGGIMMKQERRGLLVLSGQRFSIRSVHSLAGSPIQTGTPIGYVFEQDGRPVGAVEVNGAPLIRIDRSADARTRRAVVVGALALGLFWDPANSPLGREAD